MSRPLVISDCDEVLLRMVAHFREWLEENEGVDFHLVGNNFATAMRWKHNGQPLEQRDIWRFLGLFFDNEMHRQDPIEGAVEGINRIAEQADVVILTNLIDERQEKRRQQLADVGIHARVFTNQGPKGPALKSIIEEYAPSKAIFIDDLAQHHRSVREEINSITTLHLCGEPSIAPHIDCAHASGHADARIDQWSAALPWLLEQLEKEPAQ